MSVGPSVPTMVTKSAAPTRQTSLSCLSKGDTNVTDEAAAALVPPMPLIYRAPDMNVPYALRAILLALVLGSGCGDDGRPAGTAGNDSALVGGPCINDNDCEQRLCQSGSAFPGNVCTLSCGASNNCPSGSSCAELDRGWICLVDCMDTADCREQWSCESVTEAGTNGASMVSVCIGSVPAP